MILVQYYFGQGLQKHRIRLSDLSFLVYIDIALSKILFLTLPFFLLSNHVEVDDPVLP